MGCGGWPCVHIDPFFSPRGVAQRAEELGLHFRRELLPARVVFAHGEDLEGEGDGKIGIADRPSKCSQKSRRAAPDIGKFIKQLVNTS